MSRTTVSRRWVLGATAALGTLAGCLRSPSSSSPPYEAVEVDDGPVYGPGLQSEIEESFFAGLIVEDSGADRFDRPSLPPAARTFLAETDFDTHLLGLIQVAGVNSSTYQEVVDLALTTASLTVVLALRDEPPHGEDRVITTLVLRVPRRAAGTARPDQRRTRYREPTRVLLGDRAPKSPNM